MSEKVFSCGKWYTRNHPKEIISPHVMTFDEIRFWIKELSTNPAYGWAKGGVAGLSRAMGYSVPSSMTDKLTTRWIWPKEQVRLTARVGEILEGYIVPTRFGQRVDGVYTDPPVPPVVNYPRSIRCQANIAGLKFLAHDMRPAMKLPSFKNAFAEAIEWNPDKDKGSLR